MHPYGKTLNVFKRDPKTHKLIPGEYSSEELEALAKLRWEFTEKIDGTNVRVVWRPDDGNRLQILGRSDNATIHPEIVQYLMNKRLANWFPEIFPDIDVPVCIYGEAYGAGIQKGGIYSPVKSFMAFDVKVGDVWLRRADVYDVASKLGLKRVPFIMDGPLIRGVEKVKRGLQSHFGEFYAEGLVARPPVMLFDRMGRTIICKIKHKELFSG